MAKQVWGKVEKSQGNPRRLMNMPQCYGAAEKQQPLVNNIEPGANNSCENGWREHLCICGQTKDLVHYLVSAQLCKEPRDRFTHDLITKLSSVRVPGNVLLSHRYRQVCNLQNGIMPLKVLRIFRGWATGQW